MAITREQIFEVADNLDAAGQNPTLAAVRKAIGGGSFTTISEAMNEWRSRKTAEATPIRDPAPQIVTEKLTELGVDVWSIALEMANKRLASEREALEVVRVEMEESRQEAAELADQLTVELDEAKARIEVLEASEKSAKAEVDKVRSEMIAIRERAATAEARANELRIELDHAHKELEHAHKESLQLRSERDKEKELAKANVQQVEHLKSELATANVISNQVEQRANELRTELEHESHECEKLRENLKAIAIEQERVREELVTVKTKAEAEREASQERRKEAAKEAAHQAERYTKLQTERDDARRAEAAAREEAASLRGRVDVLEAMLQKNKDH